MTQHDPSDDSANRQNDTDLHQLPLSDLALFCAHELQVYTGGGTPNDRYPLELFRRAVVLRDTAAWGCIYRQYAPFVLPYLTQHPLAEPLLLQREPAALVDAVLSTLSTALTEEKLAHLNSLTAILKYLRICVHSTVADPHRGQLLLEGETAPELPTPAHAVEQQGLSQGLWQVMVELLPSEDERQLFSLLFVRGFSARAVCLHEPARFPDLAAVYRMKSRIVERLRTSERLQALFLDQ